MRGRVSRIYKWGESFFIYAEPLDLGCRENFVRWVCATANGQL